jgi:hypothetical protein
MRTRISLNKIGKGKDRFLNEIKMNFEKICKCSFKFLKSGDGSSTAMLILQQNPLFHKKFSSHPFRGSLCEYINF